MIIQVDLGGRNILNNNLVVVLKTTKLTHGKSEIFLPLLRNPLSVFNSRAQEKSQTCDYFNVVAWQP